MSVPVEFTLIAQQDLDEIQTFLLSQSPRASNTVGDAIALAIVTLSEMPIAGFERRDLTHHPIRFYPVFRYLIAYRVLADRVQIVRVVHGSRRIDFD